MQYVFVALEGAMSTLGHERQSMRTRWYRIEKANLVWVVHNRCTYLFYPGRTVHVFEVLVNVKVSSPLGINLGLGPTLGIHGERLLVATAAVQVLGTGRDKE